MFTTYESKCEIEMLTKVVFQCAPKCEFKMDIKLFTECKTPNWLYRIDWEDVWWIAIMNKLVLVMHHGNLTMLNT